MHPTPSSDKLPDDAPRQGADSRVVHGDATAPRGDPPHGTRRLTWPHGSVELQTLGGMLAPVQFTAAGHPPFDPLQVAPWADEPDAARWPGILRRLRGEWPCVPFGRCDRPSDLPAGWSAEDPGDAWGHGHAAHHEWEWLASDDPLALGLQIALPPGQPIERMARWVRAVPHEPALEVTLEITPRQACTLPVALHPTLRLDAGRVALQVPHAGPGLTYPVPAEPGRSRLAPDARFERLDCVPLDGGGHTDLTRYPQPQDGEDLLQLMDLRGPVLAHFLDAGWTVALDWDRAVLPDVMLWVSHRGRQYPPWSGRHWALGVEPLNAAFDLGRVAAPPPGHPLAGRKGLALLPGQPLTIRWRLSAWPGGPEARQATAPLPARQAGNGPFLPGAPT